MNIHLTDEMALLLETIVAETRGLEFSGFGYATLSGGELTMYDFVLLNVGSSTYTEISAEQVMKLADREDARNMRIWVHRHPVGNGIPGYQNWSSTDENTIQTTPLGSIPELTRWSASIVRTPRGWVGRVDNHLKRTTLHVEVLPHIPQEMFDMVRVLVDSYDLKMSHRKALGTESYTVDATYPDIRWPEEQYSFLNEDLDDGTAKARRMGKKSRNKPWWRVWP